MDRRSSFSIAIGVPFLFHHYGPSTKSRGPSTKSRMVLRRIGRALARCHGGIEAQPPRPELEAGRSGSNFKLTRYPPALPLEQRKRFEIYSCTLD